MSEKRGVVDLVNDLITRAIRERASDVHIDPDVHDTRVLFRIDGVLALADRIPLAITPNVIARLKVLAGLLTYQTDTPQEGGIRAAAAGLEPGRHTGGFESDIRVSTFPTIRGERAVLRIMANTRRFLALHELGHDPGLVERLQTLLARTQGLMLVVGPAGSGKTTTLAAMLDYLVRARPGASIMSIEDPVEIQIAGVTQTQLQPARGFTYATALRSLLRQDPQVLMIGEIRDAEVAHIVIDAALTGHLVLSTMHSGEAAAAIIRLRDMDVPAYQITSTLQAVLAQRLVRRVGAGPRADGGAATGESRAGDGAATEGTPPDESRGARGSPSTGRVAIGHLVQMSEALSAAIRAGADQAQLTAHCAPGSLEADAERLLRSGLTTPDEVLRCLGSERPSEPRP